MPEAIREALSLANAGFREPGLQPTILMDKPINHEQVAEYAVCYLNDAWAPKVNKLLKKGFIAFRIQTELEINGHVTMIYMAKLKEKAN